MSDAGSIEANEVTVIVDRSGRVVAADFRQNCDGSDRMLEDTWAKPRHGETAMTIRVSPEEMAEAMAEPQRLACDLTRQSG